METNPRNEENKPSLPEALFPEIGNGLLWEKGIPEKTLRSIDPTVALNGAILDSTLRETILDKWLTGPSSSPEVTETKGKKIPVVRKTEDIKPDWLEDMDKDDRPDELPVLVPDEPQQAVTDFPEEIRPEGKRVKKAVKKAQKVALAKEAAKSTIMEKASALSPFTAWLKSLRGSEYVHPFDDDFALEQKGPPYNEGISETLADLLAAQGFREQAIGMYTLLMSKFPEKSSFFAAKIEALK